MDDDLALLTIADVKVAVPAGNGIEAGLVVLREEEEPHREMRMIVGQPEARAIHVSWSNGVPPRPSTWDLFVSTISLLDARVDHVVITDVQEERHFFAQMVLYRTDVEDPLLLTARPSDAIALALRAWGAKIYARPHVLDDAGLLADGSHWVRHRREPTESPEDAAPLGGVIDVEEDEALMGGWIGTPSEPSEVAPRRRAASRARAVTSRSTKAGAAEPAKKTSSTKRTATGTTAKKASATRSAAGKSGASKSAAAKKAATKSAAAKKAATRKTPAAKAGASTRTTSRRSTSSTAVARTEAKADAVEALAPVSDAGS